MAPTASLANLQTGGGTTFEGAVDRVDRGKGLVDANEEYLRRVKERLEGTRKQDRSEEKDRIRAKHK